MKSTQRIRRASLLTVLALVLSPAIAQEAGKTLQDTAVTAQRDLELAVSELTRLRESIAAEKLPLTRRLAQLENRLLDRRAELQEQGRTLDSRNLELNNLRAGIAARKEENSYLSTLLDEYIRNLETRIHIVELQRYRDQLELARRAPENAALEPAEVFRLQVEAVQASLDRLNDLVGGTSFGGTAVGSDGRVEEVQFALIGPIALYTAVDGSSAGLAEQRLGSLEPNMLPLDDPQTIADVRDVVERGRGHVPLDTTQGSANKVEETRETLTQHVVKGGPVMIPILLLAGAVLLVVLIKWIQLSRVKRPSRRRVEALLEATRAGNFADAIEQAKSFLGPTGEMLRAGLEHVGEPKELVEEVMFETTLETRLRMQSLLSFVAVSAAAAPLLGLLGTVTGIINTFNLITVFGTGDAKTLSSGISEALITTEFGLIVAIPSLLLHAYLSRKARRVVDGMEKVAVSFLNRIPGTAPQDDEPAIAIAEKVWQILERRLARDPSGDTRRAAAGAGWPVMVSATDGPEH